MPNMKTPILFLLIFVITINLSAQIKKVAMLEPIAKNEGISSMVKDMVRGELTKSISKEDGFHAFSRNEIDQAMTEVNFQESGMVSDEQRIKLGKMELADYVCVSKISKEGSAYYLEAFLMHIESGRIDNPASSYVEGGTANVNIACQNMANELVGKKVTEQTQIVEKKETKPVEPDKEENTNPNNFVVLEVEVNFESHKFMVCDKDFSEQMKLVEAKKACYNLDYKGYSDWRLPTKAEAEVIQNNLLKFDDLNSNKLGYWTSTRASKQYENYYVWYPRETFQIGGYGATASCGVRCVRDYQ
jgi:hypothetical protein